MPAQAVGATAGKLLRVDRSVALLVATGASICGVSAVMAAAPVVEEEGASGSKVSVALATVMVFGIASMFLYPAMWQRLPGPLSAKAMGIYTGRAAALCRFGNSALLDRGRCHGVRSRWCCGCGARNVAGGGVRRLAHEIGRLLNTSSACLVIQAFDAHCAFDLSL